MNFSKTLLATLLAVALPSFADQLTAAPGSAAAAAMAGVSQAVAVDASSFVGNPANMSLFKDGLHADVSAGAVNRSIDASRLGSTDTLSSGGAATANVALIHKKNDLALGISYYEPSPETVEWDKNQVPVKGLGIGVKSEIHLPRLSLAASYQVDDKLAVGLVAQYISGSMKPGATLLASNVLGQMAADFNSVQVEGTALKVGATYAISHKLRLGASHQPKTLLPVPDYSGYMRNSSFTLPFWGQFRTFKLPAMTSFGVAWHAKDNLLLAADFDFIQWSDNKAGRMLYAQNSPGLNSIDQGVLRVGAAWQYKPNITLRGGVVLASNPLDDQRASPVMFLNSAPQSGISMGATYELSKTRTLSVAYSGSMGQEMTNMDGISSKGSVNKVLVGYSMKF